MCAPYVLLLKSHEGLLVSEQVAHATAHAGQESACWHAGFDNPNQTVCVLMS
jgi:hypothetical protein